MKMLPIVNLVTLMVAWIGQSWGRFVPSGAGAYSFQLPQLLPSHAHSKSDNLNGNKLSDAADYLFKSVLDYPPESQAKLLQDFQDSEVTPGLYQGDIAGLTPELLLAHTRVGLKWDVFPERKWENGTVPYVISSLYLPTERIVIERAISTLNFMTCVNFVPWDGKANDYLLIWPIERPSGCWSYVGKRGGQQILSLRQPDARSLRCFGSVGKPIHEFLHALGVFHEQARSDRDQHVTVVTENVITDYLHNFDKQSEVNTTFSFDYDYKSVMHYGSHFFSYSRDKPTIVPKVKGVKIGQRVMLSKTDCLKVNHLYDCLDERNPFQRDKYLSICRILGY